MLELLIPVVLLASGLAAGVMMWTQLGGMPLLNALPPDRYVFAHAFFANRYDPFMPICMLVTFLGDVLLALTTTSAALGVLFGLGAVLAAGAIVISLAKNVPVNKWIQTLDPDNLPPDFASMDPRPQWGGWNRTRAVFAVVAFGANCAALAALV